MRKRIARLAVASLAVLSMVATAAPGAASGDTMAVGLNGWDVDAIFTVGETVNGYTPPGVIDGLGAYELDENTVRVLANHELLHFRGYAYEVNGGLELTGARVSYFDIDKTTMQVVDAGLAYDTVYDTHGNIPTTSDFLGDLAGISRLCSSSVFEAHQFGGGRGFEDRVYMTGEEDGGVFNDVGGNEWVLDPETNSLWQLSDLGRGAWENVTVLDTGNRRTVAILLGDDTSPFDVDDDGVDEAAPLFLYVGHKQRNGDFPARNGLRGGNLYVWVADDGTTDPTGFNGAGNLSGTWVEVDNRSQPALASVDGSTGYDLNGYPTQSNLWTQAEALGAFGFSRPEDVATDPFDGTTAVVASTGVDTYLGGVDTFGTTYTVTTDFSDLSAVVRITYDGDADRTRALRSPDNLDWADDGLIYIQEDEAEEDTLDGEPLFGDGAANPNEAGVVRMDRRGNNMERIMNIDRSVVLDPTTAGTPVDQDAGNAGEWESSGIVDVSTLFGWDPGTLFLIDIQAHGIEDQDDFNADSRIVDGDLVEGGQLAFLYND